MGKLKKVVKKINKEGKRAVRKLKPTAKALEKTIRATVKLPSVPVEFGRKVLKGESAKKAAKESLRDLVAPVTGVADVASQVTALSKRLITDLARKVGGDSAADIVADLMRIALPLGPEHVHALLVAVEQFIKTGKLEFLNPLVILAAGEIKQARDDNWDNASPIPKAVIDTMPSEVRGLAAKARAIKRTDVRGTFNLPQFAIKHLGRATAITLIDLIVFKGSIPGHQSEDHKHLWAHELWHVNQYAGGVTQFVSRYLGNELGFRPVGSQGNGMEIEADQFACKHFPQGHPNYLDRCP